MPQVEKAYPEQPKKEKERRITKKKKKEEDAGSWMDLEIVILSKVSNNTENDKYHMVLLIHRI